jgi:hypothetical protein
MRLNDVLGHYLGVVGADWPAPEPVDLAPVVKAVAQELRGAYREKKAQLAMELPAGLVGQSDPALARVAVRSVLQWALGALPAASGGTVRVQASRQPELSDVGVLVLVEGTGTDSEGLAQLFRLGEHGVSMAVAKQAALSSGGTATAASTAAGLQVRLSWPTDDDGDDAGGAGADELDGHPGKPPTPTSKSRRRP